MLNFRTDNLRGDLYGGLTAGVVALPLALAFGEASGAGPIAGLYGAIFVGFFAALFGGTESQISGPTGPMIVVFAGVYATLNGEAELRAEFEVSHRGDTFADNNHARSGSVAKSVESVLHAGKSAQVRQLSAARMEATARCSGNLAAMKAAGVETLKLDEDASRGGVESSELIALIAAHALQRCEAHPHGDGARAFYRAARRVELAAMACQPQYKKRGGRGT